MALLATYTQQPADKLDYDIYFAGAPDGTEDWLVPGDTIESVVVESPVGIVIDHLASAFRVKLWVSGGTSGSTYKVTVTATTAEGRTIQNEVKFKIKEV